MKFEITNELIDTIKSYTENAKWYLGEKLNEKYKTCSFGCSHYYCHYDDTEEIVEEIVKPLIIKRFCAIL